MNKKENDGIELNNFIECSRLGTWEWNVQTGETVFNEMWAKILGYTLEELSPVSIQTWIDYTHPDDLEQSNRMLERHFAGELAYYDCTCRMKHRDGHWIWIQDTGKVVSWTDDGKPLLMCGTHADISDQKQAEQKFKEICLRQEAILASVPDIIAQVDSNKVYTWMNEAGLQFFGDDAIGKEAEYFFEGNQDTYSMVQPLFNGDPNVIYIESWQRRKDGEKRLLAWWCRVLKDTNEMVVGALSTARDITDIRKAEAEQIEEKERLGVTLRSIGDAVIATDRSGNIVLMNKVAENLTGYRFDEVAHKPLFTAFNIINEITRQPCDNPVAIVLKNNCVVGLANHTALIRRDGSEITIADSGSPIINNDGAIIGVVLVFRDISEKAKIENTLQNMQKLESLGILAGGIAHDFNNLLSGIFGNIDLAAEITKEKEVAGYLSKALGTIDRARALTGQLLTFSKGGVPIKKLERLPPFIEETTKFALSGSNISPSFSIPDDLWQCEFDRNQIGQVLDNIVINAQQAMPEGGSVEITAENVVLQDNSHPMLKAGKFVKITIKDHGIGMPQEILTKIFDPFFTTKAKGHGLGLATCYSIVNRHEGSLEVHSEPGKGSTFTIYLPSSAEKGVDEIVTASTIHRGSGLILIMDDEAVVKEAICSMLKTMGYEVHCASNSKEAINEVETMSKSGANFTAVILDLTIPGGPGGKETVYEIRKIDQDVPVFVASGYADTPIMANPAAYGFNDSIAKPFRKPELAELLNKHLKKKK